MSLMTAEAVALPPAPGTDEQQRVDEVAVDGNAVGHARNLGDGRVLGHHGRVHALLDAALGQHGDAEQLDAVAKIIGGLDVGLGDRLDAFDVHLIERHPRAEGQARQQRQLVRGVEPADVERRISLGVALGLRLLEHIGERAAFRLHLGEDVVAGTVKDAVDAANRVARQRLAQRS